MKLKYLALVGAAAGVLAATSANATAFFIDYTGTSAANGTFTVHLTGDETNGVINSITGTRNGIAVTGLSSYAGADQHIIGTFPYVDFAGVSYSVFGGPNYNLYLDSSGLFELNSADNAGGFASADAPIASITASVPEPATWGLMILGFGMIGFAARARRRQTVRVAYA